MGVSPILPARTVWWLRGVPNTICLVRFFPAHFPENRPPIQSGSGKSRQAAGRKAAFRTIQQYILGGKFIELRLAHRFAADQTFRAEGFPQFRLRYRLALEIPLNGRSVDPQEWYLKLSNEYLHLWQQQGNRWEIRWVPLLGHTFARNNKVEFGIDYRLSSPFSELGNHSFWINVNWYVKRGHKT